LDAPLKRRVTAVSQMFVAKGVRDDKGRGENSRDKKREVCIATGLVASRGKGVFVLSQKA